MNNRGVKDYCLLAGKGMAMGAADVVPGVSGGTIAFITGIYNELLHSLKQLGPQALLVLYKQGFKAFWQYINGTFLVVLFGGILFSLKTFASIISFCLDNYPLLVWGFFSGLIAASIILLLRQQERWGWKEIAAFLIGAAIVVLISIAKPSQLPGDWWMLFLGGFIAICAMILPGISGSFLLLLMGLYPVFLDALKTFDLVALSSFGAGCVCGLLLFSRLLSWLLDNYYRTTLATLTGFLLGSLNVTWPWKETLSTVVDRHGEVIPVVQQNVLPGYFEKITGIDSEVHLVAIFVGLGIFLVLSVDAIARKYTDNTLE